MLLNNNAVGTVKSVGKYRNLCLTRFGLHYSVAAKLRGTRVSYMCFRTVL